MTLVNPETGRGKGGRAAAVGELVAQAMLRRVVELRHEGHVSLVPTRLAEPGTKTLPDGIVEVPTEGVEQAFEGAQGITERQESQEQPTPVQLIFAEHVPEVKVRVREQDGAIEGGLADWAYANYVMAKAARRQRRGF